MKKVKYDNLFMKMEWCLCVCMYGGQSHKNDYADWVDFMYRGAQ